MKATQKEYTSSVLDDLFENADKSISKKINAKMQLAALIDEAIKINGWSKIKFANEINQKPSVITKWLSGTHNFTIETLIDIGHILNIDLINISKVSNNVAVQPFVIEIKSTDFEKSIADACVKYTATSITSSNIKTIESNSKKFSILNS
jgi:transcriptional regulator with XRE-family HTH domain